MNKGDDIVQLMLKVALGMNELNRQEPLFLKHLLLTVFSHIYSMAEYITSNIGVTGTDNTSDTKQNMINMISE